MDTSESLSKAENICSKFVRGRIDEKITFIVTKIKFGENLAEHLTASAFP